MLDCVIIGGGPAGLTAATYLARFRRPVAVINDGKSRIKRIPLARNVPGFADGISGAELHDQMLRQALKYGATITRGRVTRLAREDAGFTYEGDVGGRAKTILIATGSKLNEPVVEGLNEAVAAAIVRYCPICDGLETADRSVAVLGAKPDEIQEAIFLSRFAKHVLFVAETGSAFLDHEQALQASRHGVELADTPLREMSLESNSVLLRLVSGRHRRVDVLYPCLGCTPETGLAPAFGVKIAEKGGVLTDRHQRTSAPGIYAAGDVLQGLDQIASACGQAAIAATAIHNDLRATELI